MSRYQPGRAVYILQDLGESAAIPVLDLQPGSRACHHHRNLKSQTHSVPVLCRALGGWTKKQYRRVVLHFQ